MLKVNAEEFLTIRKQRIEQMLDRYLPKASVAPQRLHQAMRYAVLANGKRLRPLLVFAAGEAMGASLEKLDSAACAIELMHCYSLVHDDLPAMDDDDLRRGKPSCHKAFDEATAILVGDALQALAFEILGKDDTELSAIVRLQMLTCLAQACGSMGMAGGQALEFDPALQNPDLKQLEHLHQLKTGVLIRTSVQLGAIAAGAKQTDLEILDHYAKCLGLAFQIQDDILDYQDNPDNPEPLSYVNFLGIEQSQKKVSELYQQALNSIQVFDKRSAQPLFWLADYMINSH